MEKLILSIAVALLTILPSCHRTYLSEKGWNPKTAASLNRLIAEYGKDSRGYTSSAKPYAVFDFDNTTLINDIEMTLLVWQIEHMAFAFAPEEMFPLLTGCLGDIDKPLGLEGREEVTAGMLAADISAAYREIRTMDTGADWRASESFRDFRAKLRTMYDGVENTYDYATACLWIINLFKGMTPSQVDSLTKTSVNHWLSHDGINLMTWESPDRGKAGKIRASFPIGLVLTPEMKELYGALTDNGFDVYICSASMEEIVEAMACDPAYGLGLPKEKVFGLRLLRDHEGKLLPAYDSTYIQTFKEGKTAAIREYIAPGHQGEEPLLVAGDSNGDYSMLTSFEGMKVGLIIDAGAGAPLSLLYPQAQEKESRYCLQRRDLAKGILVPVI